MKTVFAMPLNKSPGPDGYSIEFIRASWATVGSDVINAVKEFFRNGRLLKDLNNTAICLIPKSSEACKLKDYRPISCCNIVYKVISKIIANRLKPILQECISLNQAAFLKGRSLGENVLLASELIRNYQKPSSPKSCMLKVDIRKAFDTICWEFVIKILEAQGFPPMFCIWVKECITSPRFPISINGELAGFFPGRKGLRQGDSISPYLFIMVMEVLSRLLEKSVAEERMRLHPMCSNPQVTHLLFADDLLIFSDGSRHSLSGIKTILGVFREMCGLDINAEKTEIFFGGYNDVEISVLSALSGFKIGFFPTRYLGLPLDSSRISYATLQPFIERITAKIHVWTSKFLSFAGKIRLISSVIYGMVNFWSSVFVLPKRFYEKVDSLCSAFLWKNKTTSAMGSRVAWKDVCRPKKEGGLGIRLLEDFEMVYRLKHVSNFFTNSGSIWVAWLKGNIFNRKDFWIKEDSNRLSKPVRSMLQLRNKLEAFLKCEVRDGHKARFWYDCWTDLGPLISFMGTRGPTEFQIRQDASVAQATHNGFWRFPAARSVAADTSQIVIAGTEPPNDEKGSDVFFWCHGPGVFKGSFSSKSTWSQLRVSGPIVAWYKTIWFKEAIPRCSFIAWLVYLARLPTRDRLIRWGLNVQPGCVLCSNGSESHEHLFFECSFSSEIWSQIAGSLWPNPPTDLASVTTSILSMQSSKAVVAKLWLQILIYLLWRERNARIFSANPRSSASSISSAVDRMMRDRLLSFPATSASSTSLLQTYFSFRDNE
uniref:LINE-1 retrotransposable element ORF2 protein n=1 Tax=Noccaea caerulescens TaxID=107243 RepID=A0A1J3EJP2_NOCCA